MRDAFRGLTTRGRLVLGAGFALVVIAWQNGQRDLLRVGVLALVLPLLCAFLVARTRFRLTCARGVGAPRIGVGAETVSVIRLENSSRLPSGLLLVTDRIPALLGVELRAVVPRLAPGGRTELSTVLEGTSRGRFEVGPVSLTLRDPFGLCELQRSFTATDTVVVTPRTVPLPPLGLAGVWGGRGDSEARSIAHTGDDDVIPRSYRIGDDLRRVHWRATARSGELMVRREEQPWRTTATILLDRRESTHRGRYPDSSFEAAVSIAASLALHLTRHGLRVRILDVTGTTLASAEADGDDEGLLLDSLAVVGLTTGGGLRDTAPIRRALADGTLIAIVGALAPPDVEVLAGLRTSGSVAAALVVDVAGWDADDRLAETAPRTVAALARHRWTAAVVPGHRPEDLEAALLTGWEALSHAALAGVAP